MRSASVLMCIALLLGAAPVAAQVPARAAEGAPTARLRTELRAAHDAWLAAFDRHGADSDAFRFAAERLAAKRAELDEALRREEGRDGDAPASPAYPEGESGALPPDPMTTAEAALPAPSPTGPGAFRAARIPAAPPESPARAGTTLGRLAAERKTRAAAAAEASARAKSLLAVAAQDAERARVARDAVPWWNLFRRFALDGEARKAREILESARRAEETTGRSAGLLAADAEELERLAVSPFVVPFEERFYLAGEEFRFHGVNAYDLFTRSPEDRVDEARIDAAFDHLAANGCRVVRTWAFNNEAWHGFVTAVHPEIRFGAENQFRILDRILHAADRRGIKIILCFANYWKDYGGVPWHLRQFGLPADPAKPGELIAYFRDPRLREAHKRVLEHFLLRVNTYSGRRYADDPAIFAIELMNEPRCPADRSGRTLRDWIDEMGAFVRTIDAGHMIAAGLEGADPVFGGHDEGTPFAMLHRSPYLSFTTAHIYPEYEKPVLSIDGFKKRVERYVETSRALEWTDAAGRPRRGKPFVLEEWNVRAPLRDAYFAEMVPFLKRSAAAGFLVWNWFPEPSADEFALTAEDREHWEILRR